MKEAIFINGVYEDVLEEILAAQKKDEDLVCYLQPYKSHVIQLLKKASPTQDSPITLYLSVTSSLGLVSHTAQVVGWEDKRMIAKDANRLSELNMHIEKFQPKEGSIYPYQGQDESKPCINLIAVQYLKKIENPFSVRNLVKTKDRKPCKPKTRAGGWSYVIEAPDWIDAEESTFKELCEAELAELISKSREKSTDSLQKSLDSAPRKPERIQVISQGFRRNPDVIVAVLNRARGVCEICKIPAPFIRKSDNSPYLEVHHIVTLADKGDDTLENAVAICPNCHREAHFGI